MAVVKSTFHIPDGLDDALRASTACRRWHELATAGSVHVADEDATRGHGRMWAARLRSSSARGPHPGGSRLGGWWGGGVWGGGLNSI